MSTVTYRTPTETEVQALSELGTTTFVDTFGALYNERDLQNYLHEVYGIAAIAKELANPLRLYRVAATEDTGALVAYCKLGLDVTLPWTPPPGRRAMEFKQLYVRTSHIGTGVAQTLMQWALDEATQRGFDDMILSVFSENFRAQKFYQRYGFKYVGRFDFMVGEQADNEFLYHRALRG